MGYRVLVVENEATTAFDVQSMIQEAGHEVICVAKSGEQALDVAVQMHPDIALVDIELPGINGIEATRRLVEKGVDAVIILAEHKNKELIEQAASAGAFTYLLKPANADCICANIELAAARAAEFSVLKKEAEDIKAALETRKQSERAKHILMLRLSLSEEAAFAHLRHKCRNQNKTMRRVAEEIIRADAAFLSVVEKEPQKKEKDPLHVSVVDS